MKINDLDELIKEIEKCIEPGGAHDLGELQISIRNLLDRFEKPSQFTAVDMATAAAEGFRDGQASVVVDLEGIDITCTAGWNAWKACRAAIIAAGGKVKE